jgi:hypothetical protein
MFQANTHSHKLQDRRARFCAQLQRLIEAGVLSAAEADEALHRLAPLALLEAH